MCVYDCQQRGLCDLYKLANADEKSTGQCVLLIDRLSDTQTSGALFIAAPRQQESSCYGVLMLISGSL